MILSLVQLRVASLALGQLNLAQIRINQIPDIGRIERALMLLDDLPIEIEHILAVLRDLIARRLLAGQILHRRDIVDGVHFAEQPHSLFDQKRETLEFRVVDRESHGHHHVADHIADGHRVRGTHVDRLVAGVAQVGEQILDFGHNACLHQVATVAHVGHAELPQFDVQKSSLVFPQIADAVYDAYIWIYRKRIKDLDFE